MRARTTRGFQERRPSTSTRSISASMASTEKTRSALPDDGTPSMSVHARGTRIVVPSPTLATTFSGPAITISMRCPSSGWCLRVMWTSAIVEQLLYWVWTGRPLAKHPALEVRAQLLLDVPGQPALVVLAGVSEKRLEVLADQAVQDRLGRAPRERRRGRGRPRRRTWRGPCRPRRGQNAARPDSPLRPGTGPRCPPSPREPSPPSPTVIVPCL